MKMFDITPKISESLAVFPGDVGFSRQISMSFQKGNHLDLSAIQTTLHLGAHADSSSHYHKNGEGIESRNLSSYLGNVQVIQVETKSGQRISIEDLKGKKISQKRVLFRTDSFPNPAVWNSDFMSLSPELILYLHQKEVCLIGIDTPSVDPETSKALESHQALFQAQMAVLEGLDLKNVTEGEYTLIALPLPIVGADASPVRAILLQATNVIPDQLTPE